MRVSLYTGIPDDATTELRPPDYTGDFASLDFPSRAMRRWAYRLLRTFGRLWLDSNTLCIVED